MTIKELKQKVPPVKVGQIIEATPSGMAEKDAYLSYNEFIIFLKRLPPDMREKKVRVKVTAVKTSFGFAEYQNEVKE